MNRLDKLKAEIAEMNAEEMARLLINQGCNYCQNHGKIEICIADCFKGIKAYLEQEIRPSKTLADVFFERNPGAEKNVSGQPQCCAKNAGLTDECLNTKAIECKCVDCWNRPWEGEGK